MCGIFGYNFERTRVDKTRKSMMVAVLALTNDTRGGDSWGFYNGTHLAHGIGDISNAAYQMIDSPIMMAHTRKATTGAITTENAHPFDIGSIIGAHNGIITNHSELNSKHKRNYQVDSMHIFGHLDQDLPLSEIHGYGAIEYVKKDDKRRIYLAKVSYGGDLAIFGIGKGPKNYLGVVWSSSDTHVKAALRASGLPHFEFEVKPHQLYYVENGMFYLEGDRKHELGTMSYGTATNYSGSGRGYYHHGHGWADFSEDTNPRGTMIKEEEKDMSHSERRLRDAWEREMEAEMVEEAETVESDDWSEEKKALITPTAESALKYTTTKPATDSDMISAGYELVKGEWIKIRK